MARYIFTHGDLDGCGAAILTSREIGGFTDVIPCQYQGSNAIDKILTRYLDDKVECGDVIILTDILPSYDVCQRMHVMRSDLAMLKGMDHHKSTIDLAGEYPWIEHSCNEQSATLMAARGIRRSSHIDGVEKERLYAFANAVDAWDRWLLDSTHRERGERLDKLYKLLGFDRFYSQFTRFFDADMTMLGVGVCDALISIEGEVVSEAVKSARENPVLVDKRGYRYVAVYPNPEYISQVGHAILDDQSQLDYVALLAPQKGVIELRSRDGGVDVSAIAIDAGGGGHQAAAGFPYEFSNPKHF